MIDNKITIKDDEKVNIQRGAIGHRSTWTGLTYKYAAEAGKAEEAEKIIRQAISETGRVQGNALREQCPDPTSCKSFCDTMFTPTLLKSFEVDVKEKTDDVLDVEFHHCPLLKAWQDLGFDDEMCAKLCDIAMDGDRNIAKAMGFDFHLGDTIGKMVEAGNRLGMLFDVSHLSDRSFWDLSALSKKPILATHSDFRALCSCNRNLTDEMAQKIVRQDGMIGLNLCPKFLSDREERQTLFGFFDHLEYGLAHFGEDHLGFGLDIDGIDRYPEPLTPDSSLHDRIAEFLLKHYPQRVVEKISGSNFISFLKKYL